MFVHVVRACVREFSLRVPARACVHTPARLCVSGSCLFVLLPLRAAPTANANANQMQRAESIAVSTRIPPGATCIVVHAVGKDGVLTATIRAPRGQVLQVNTPLFVRVMADWAQGGSHSKNKVILSPGATRHLQEEASAVPAAIRRPRARPTLLRQPRVQEEVQGAFGGDREEATDQPPPLRATQPQTLRSALSVMPHHGATLPALDAQASVRDGPVVCVLPLPQCNMRSLELLSIAS